MNNWYVIQTKVNEEEKLVQMVETMLSKKEGLYEECFVPKYDNIWKLQGMCLVDTEVLFPGYVFVITNQPEELYTELKQVPKFSKILGESGEREEKNFVSLMPREQEFMENILDRKDHVAHRSIVRRDGRGMIVQAEGPLKHYVDRIVKVDYPHRKLLIEMDLFGQKRRVKFCFMGEEDCIKEKVQLPQWEEKQPFDYQVGEEILLCSDAYEQKLFVIKKVNEKKRTVTVEVELFGRVMELTVGEDEIQKNV